MNKTILIFIAKRVLMFFVSTFLATTLIFFVYRMIPGDPLGGFLVRLSQQFSESIPNAPEIIAEYKRMFGLDKDLLTQYINFLERFLLRGDLGPSFMKFPTSAQTLIFEALPWSIGLLGLSVIISWVVGNLIGLIVAWKRGTKLDSILFTAALGLSQIPFYFLAVLLLLFFAYTLMLLPQSGAYSPHTTPSLSMRYILDLAEHAILPSLSLILVSFARWLISMRSLMVTILGEDYLLFARAKGLSKNRILMRYAMRNTLLPQVTGLAMSLGFTVTGSLLVETIFLYPGIGTLFATALRYPDYNVILGCTMLTTITVTAANLIVDLMYPLIDPRIKTGAG